MHNIDIDEVSDEFRRCWIAAGRHIEDKGVGESHSWLRAHLNPPFLEHLSFRLGNQLFYIRLEDIDGRLQTPGDISGLVSIAEGCAGHACIMPMQMKGAGWEPAETGWGLLDAITLKRIHPPALVSDKKIVMTDWELHDFAVQVVRTEIENDGGDLISWTSNPGVNPSVWFTGESGQEWVVVRAIRYPQKTAQPPEDLDAVRAHFKTLGYSGYFASVAVASADDPFDAQPGDNGSAAPLYRGHGLYVSYGGLRKL